MSGSPPFRGGSSLPLCPQCGAQLTMESRFCGSCGAVLADDFNTTSPDVAVAAPAVVRPGDAWSKAPASSPSRPPPADRASQPPAAVRNAARTMIGVQLSQHVPAAPLAPPPPAQFPQAPPATGAAMPPAPGGPVPVQNASRTMIGVQFDPSQLQGARPVTPGAPGLPAAPIAPAAPSAPSPGAGGAHAGPVAVANVNQTMIGVSLTASPGGIEGLPTAPTPRRSERPPMIGGVAPGIPPDTNPNLRMAPPPTFAPMAGTDMNASGRISAPQMSSGAEWPKPRRNSSNRTIIVVAVVVLLAIVGGGLVYFLRSNRPEVAGDAVVPAQVRAGPGGALQLVLAAGAVPVGASVRYGTQTATAAAAGELVFTLDPLGDRVGTIDVPIDVTPAGAASTRRMARFVLAYRVEPELAGLAGEHPQLRLVFRVPPGAQLLVNAQPVSTDPRSGVGYATLDGGDPLPPNESVGRELNFAVQVRAPDGTTTNGTYALRIPRTPFVLEEPDGAWLTSFDRVLIHARAAGAQRMTVNGAVATASHGSLETAVTLPAPGTHTIRLVAYSATGAPALLTLNVERVAPATRGVLERFMGTSRAGLTELISGSIANGTRVRWQGRVLGTVREHGGGGTFQVVSENARCPATQCVIWVDVPPGVNVRDGAAVTIVGATTGRRSWTPTSGERRTDPVVHAAFLEGGG